MEDILGSALGRWLADNDGLRAAYLPDGVQLRTARAIVRGANHRKPPADVAAPPLSLFIGRSGQEVDGDIPTISAADAIRYRQDDRLLVVAGRHPELASVVGSFREVLGKSFPAAVAKEGFVPLVKEILPMALAAAGIEREVPEEAIGVMAQTLEDARTGHEKMRQGSKPWNAYWFDHVSVGLENLVTVLQSRRADDPSLDLPFELRIFIPASFALPQRGLGLPKKPQQFDGGKFKEAAEKAWSDESTIRTTVQQLAHHEETRGSVHALSNVAWEGFDETLASEDNLLLALAKHSRMDPAATLAFSELSLQQFIDPWSQEAVHGNIRVFSEDVRGMRSLSVSELPEQGPDLVDMNIRYEGTKPVRLESGLLRIRVPVLADVTSLDATASSARIESSAAALTWSGNLVVDSGGVWAVGNLSMDIRRLPFRIPSRLYTLRATTRDSDVLAGKIDQSKSRLIILSVADIPGVWAQRLNEDQAPAGKPEYIGPDRISATGTAQEQEVSWTTDDVGAPYKFLAWGAEEGPSLPLGAEPAVLFNGRDRLFEFSFKVSDLDEFDLGDCHYSLRATQNRATDYAPVVAAVNGNRVSNDDPTPGMTTSLAGRYEQLVADNVSDPDWVLGLGHVVLPTDRENVSVLDAEWCQMARVLMPKALTSAWSAVFGGSVPDELLHSEEAVAFRSAFVDLDVATALQPFGSDVTAERRWPSRVPWSGLWTDRREVLDKYLDTHTALVFKAHEIDDPFGILWATYPFSMSGWTTSTSASCEAIYISPLHPVRLAWLASVEGTLKEAKSPSNLAGTIEGWRFPYVGPCGTAQGYSIAVPCDGGEEQLFMGWSLLIAAELQVPRPLQAPERFGRDRLPGSSASGLNATSAGAALRDFHRLHPHVSTLTIDLASTAPSQRLPEIDDAVVQATKSWTVDSEKLPGGVRVLDSLNRHGGIPRMESSRILDKSVGIPFSWTRYRHEAGQTQQCNIRLLQDSGVAVFAGNAKPSDGANRGLVGSVPLRRFELLDATSARSARSVSIPALSEQNHESAFTRCLRAIEGVNSQPKISALIQNAMLVDRRADWAVSGEAMINPGAMASMVHQHALGAQMLWEWRPPFLGPDRNVPALARRPFISVARVPSSFREQLSKMLTEARGQNAAQGDVDNLLNILGSRGIGLSSLLSMGGTHSSGALGFYLALRLMENIRSDHASDFVLPIDASDAFLKSLAGSSKHGSRDKRADLLAIRLMDNEIILTPIEIKFYGLGAENHSLHLPDADSGDFKEATGQLTFTLDLLRTLAKRHLDDCSDLDSPDAAIWSNSLAAMVEVGMKLCPSPAGRLPELTRRFRSLIEGNLDLRIGKPLVAYFSHNARTASGQETSVHTDLLSHNDAKNQFKFGAQVFNGAAAFRAAEDPNDPIVSGWRSLYEWSVAPEVPPAKDLDRPGGLTGQSDIEFPPPFDVSGTPVNELSGPENSLSPGASEPIEHRPFDASSKIQAEGIRFPVGHVLHTLGDAEADFWPGNTELNQLNIGVVGDLGTGKTQLLKALILQMRRNAKRVQPQPLSMLIFDYKKDFQGAEFLDAVGGRLLQPYRIPLNLFTISGDYSRQKAYRSASRFSAILERIYGGIGPKQRQRLNDVVVSLFEQAAGQAPTLGEVYDAYLAATASPDAMSAILQSFHYNEVFSEDKSELKSLSELLDDAVLVVAVDSFGTDQQMKNSLVTVFLNMYYDYMLTATKWPYVGTNPQLRTLNSFLLVDEAINIMGYRFPVLHQLLLQGREYGFGVILSSQYLSHFKQPEVNYGEPLLTWFIHKVPNVKVSELHQLGLTNLSDSEASRIPHLKQHQALYSSLGFTGRFISGTPYYELVEKDWELLDENDE